MTIPENHSAVWQRIDAALARAGRPSGSVQLIAVSKFRPLEQTAELHRLGQRHFGENRVQEGQDKIPKLPGDIVWHLIGRLQTNKAKYLPGLFHWIHSIDRIEIAEAVEKAFAKADKSINVLMQINISGEEQKAGVAPADAIGLLRRIQELPHLNLRGLMTMAPFEAEPEETRPVFRGLRELAESLREQTGLPLPELSMGMTNDFEVAIEEGATMVRIGTALYEG